MTSKIKETLMSTLSMVNYQLTILRFGTLILNVTLIWLWDVPNRKGELLNLDGGST